MARRRDRAARAADRAPVDRAFGHSRALGTSGLAVWLVALAALVALAVPARVSATNPWVLSVSPTTLTQGVATNVSVSVTDGSEMIGCIVVNVPAGFTVLTASVASVPGSTPWTSAVAGSGPTSVTFAATATAGRLNAGGVAVFVIRVVAAGGPLPAWTAQAYKGLAVDSRQLNGGPAQQPAPFTITSPGPTPTPASTPPPTDPPTASATPSSTAAGSTPSPTDTPGPGMPAVPWPSESAGPASSAAPSPSPSSLQSPSAVATDVPSDQGSAAGGTDRPTSGGAVTPVGGNGGPETQLDIQGLPAGGTVQLEGQAVGGMGMFAWGVPALFLGLPGLILILVMAAQAAFASIFVPVTRRVLGQGRRRTARS